MTSKGAGPGALPPALRVLGGLLACAVFVLVIARTSVNGWGSLVWLGTVIAMWIVRSPHRNATRDNTIKEKRSRNVEGLLLVVYAGANILPYVHLTSGALGFANYEAPAWLPATGLIIAIPGVYVFQRSHIDLGRNWSPTLELRDQQTLITTGIYRRIRHPMYAGFLLIFTSWTFLIHNWIAGPAALAAFAVIHVIRIPREEQMMRDEFGSVYDDYVARTGRLLPKWGVD